MYRVSHLYTTSSAPDTQGVGDCIQSYPNETVSNTLPNSVNTSDWYGNLPTQYTNYTNYAHHPIPHNPSDLLPNNDTIAVSTSFHPNADPPPDTVFVSNDNVFFYTAYFKILSAAPGAFEAVLGSSIRSPQFREMVITLDVPSSELNIILHALYDTSPEANSPDFETLVRAVDHMPIYGILPEVIVSPTSPLYKLILAHAPLHPLDTYALAAHHKINSLATIVSSHLLSHDLSTVSDDMAKRIGPVYLMRLCLLHSGRFNALRGILLHPPIPHPPTRECGFEDQKKVARAWALVSAYLVWDARPDTSTYSLTNTLNPILQHITCEYCERLLKEKIKDVVVRWTSVKVTIISPTEPFISPAHVRRLTVADPLTSPEDHLNNMANITVGAPAK